MSKSTLDAVYVSLKQEAREEVLKSLQPKIAKLQALGDEILTELSAAIADTTGPKKRGPKKGAKRGPKKGAKRGPKPGSKRAGRPKAAKKAAKKAAGKVAKKAAKKAAPKKAVKKAVVKKAAAKKSGSRTPKGALENGIKDVLKGAKGAVGVSGIRDGLMKTDTFKKHNPKTLYSQISQKIGKLKRC